MTIGNYISAVREKLADTITPYRVADTEIKNSLAVALSRAKQVRTSLRYTNGRLLTGTQETDFAAAPTSTIVRAELDSYAEALAMVAAARVLENDNSDTLNVSLAEKWRGQGMELLQI